jgi:chromate reductase, NAD(P)H dehydrogenase (quinone)
MKIIAISGSLRKASYNTALLRSLPELAPPGMDFDFATLHGIPVYDGDDEAANGKPETVKALDARIRAADGVIIATPEYNFSVPGGLKNATDWLSRNDNPLSRKPIGIMGASAGPLGTGRAQYHLRQNIQGLDAVAMPKPEVFVGLASTKFDAEGKLADEATRKVVAGWLKAFEEWVRLG